MEVFWVCLMDEFVDSSLHRDSSVGDLRDQEDSQSQVDTDQLILDIIIIHQAASSFYKQVGDLQSDRFSLLKLFQTDRSTNKMLVTYNNGQSSLIIGLVSSSAQFQCSVRCERISELNCTSSGFILIYNGDGKIHLHHLRSILGW